MKSATKAARERKIRFVDTSNPKPLRKYIARPPNFKHVLDERLSLQKKKGNIESEQWYRNPAIWLSATAMINPYRTIFTELEIIQRQLCPRNDFPDEIGQLVFFGVGNSDSEIALLKRIYGVEVMGRNIPCIYAIDVQEQFLRIFAQNCLSTFSFGTCIGAPDFQQDFFYFQGYESLFQDISGEDLMLPRERLPEADGWWGVPSPHHRFSHSMFVALGNVVGNFEDQGEIFSIFRKLGARTLVIGAHICDTLHSLSRALEQYKLNEILSDFVLAPYAEQGEPLPRPIWRMDLCNNAIVAELEDGARLFYSKKYYEGELEEYAKKFGFSTSRVYRHMHSALYIFKREE